MPALLLLLKIAGPEGRTLVKGTIDIGAVALRLPVTDPVGVTLALPLTLAVTLPLGVGVPVGRTVLGGK